MPSSEGNDSEFLDLCRHIGLALVVWQEVEEAHFGLFVKMLGSDYNEVSAVVYFSVESFEARRKMVGNMAHYFLTAKADKTIWNDDKGGLQKELKDANENRNKLAHYNVEEDLLNVDEEDGVVTVDLGPPRLRPHKWNLVSRLRGLTPDKPEHNLSVAEVAGYVREFRKLARRIRDFSSNLTLPPQPGVLERAVAPRPDPPGLPLQFPGTPKTEGDPPSD
jgi:hypothetical protein